MLASADSQEGYARCFRAYPSNGVSLMISSLVFG